NASDDSDIEGSGLTYQLTGNVDDALFEIDSSTGELAFLSAPDFEAPLDVGADNTYEVEVTVTDSEGLTDSQSVTVTVEDVDEGGGTANSILYVSFSGNGTVDGLSFRDEDILAFDLVSEQWELLFDGSDVGLDDDIDSVHVSEDGSIFLGVKRPTTLIGLGAVDDSDIVRFTPTSTGSNTAGSFEMFFDGSDVGLTTSGEDVDGFGFAPDGRLVVSALGSVQVSGLRANDEDLLVFNETSLGTTTSGSFEQYFDGSDLGLSIDVNGFSIGTDEIALTTQGRFNLSGGDDSDIVRFLPSSLGSTTDGTFGGLIFDGSAVGGIDALSLNGSYSNPL
ncbi:MAG: cadherin repeat domain-containing protein, partial [Cyanobacteria bacterium P01_F01_bin.3]